MDSSLPLVPGLIIFAILLFLNAMFVAAEFAYITVRRGQIQHLAATGDKRARTTLRSINNLDFYVAASQLGITMATLGIGYLGEPVIARLIEPLIIDLVGGFAPAFSHGIAIGVAFGLATFLHIVYGEFVPKTIAIVQPTRTSLWLVYPMEVFVRIFRPIIWGLNAAGFGILRLFGMKIDPVGDEPLRAEDLALTFESSASAGLISRRELDLSRNTLRLASLEVNDLMAPRGEIVGIPLDASREDITRTFAEHRFTRYPVYDGTLDNVVGILDAKQAVFDVVDDNRDWHNDIQQALILPENVTIEHALEASRDAGHALIILADEFGVVAGVLSLFDIVEFLAGHLPDEYEADRSRLESNPDGSMLASGLLHLIDLEDELDIEVPDIDAHTLGGLVMELLQRVPDEGDEVALNGYRMRVVTMDNNRVEQVLLIPTHHASTKERVS